MIDTRSFLRVAISGALVTGTFAVAACGSSEKVTKTTTVERSVEAPTGTATTTTTTQRTTQ